jgi:Arc/MetJ-type ribon-helix-helix transcriptional regulator
MEIVTVRFQEDILKRIDENLSLNNYNSRTEFIREAVREKLSDLDRSELINKFLEFRGKTKKSTSVEENRKTKELVSKELMEELDKRFI